MHAAEISYGQSGLIASSADFAAFIEELLGGRVVGEAALAEMQEHTECDCHGLGLSFRDTAFGLAIGHAGSDTGARAEVWRFVDLDATIVLLMNAGDSGNIGKLFDRLEGEVMQVALEDL